MFQDSSLIRPIRRESQLAVPCRGQRLGQSLEEEADVDVEVRGGPVQQHSELAESGARVRPEFRDATAERMGDLHAGAKIGTIAGDHRSPNAV
jgi:hypothetical protein